MTRSVAVPDLAEEAKLWALGHTRVAGLDEAGRGAWAGPVVAGAVILPAQDSALLVSLAGVRDSKQLTAVQRERLLPVIQRHALTWALGIVPAPEIDEVGIVAATRRAMAMAVDRLPLGADALLVDHLRLPEIPLPQCSLPKGDAHVLSIAAASIVAKVYRDQMMVDLDAAYPGYGLARHKGYGTALHRAALEALGPTAIHRRSFAPVANLAERKQHHRP